MKKVGILVLLLLGLGLFSCQRDGLELDLALRSPLKETRKVLLLYEAGYNDLSEYIRDNITTLMDKDAYLPGKGRNEDVLLVVSHLRPIEGKKDTPPVLIRIYKEYGRAVKRSILGRKVLPWPVPGC